MERSSPDVAQWIGRWDDEQREQVLWFTGRVHAAGGEGISEAIKWHRLTFTVGDDWHHWLCAIAVTRQAVNLTFHKGSLLADPAGLLRGDGRYLRSVPHAQATEHPDAVTALVREAIARQTDMLDDIP